MHTCGHHSSARRGATVMRIDYRHAQALHASRPRHITKEDILPRTGPLAMTSVGRASSLIICRRAQRRPMISSSMSPHCCCCCCCCCCCRPSPLLLLLLPPPCCCAAAPSRCCCRPIPLLPPPAAAAAAAACEARARHASQVGARVACGAQQGSARVRARACAGGWGRRARTVPRHSRVRARRVGAAPEPRRVTSCRRARARRRRARRSWRRRRPWRRRARRRPPSCPVRRGGR